MLVYQVFVQRAKLVFFVEITHKSCIIFYICAEKLL